MKKFVFHDRFFLVQHVIDMFVEATKDDDYVAYENITKFTIH